MSNRHYSTTPDPRDGGSAPRSLPFLRQFSPFRPFLRCLSSCRFLVCAFWVLTADVSMLLDPMDLCSVGEKLPQWWSGIWWRLPPSRGSEVGLQDPLNISACHLPLLRVRLGNGFSLRFVFAPHLRFFTCTARKNFQKGIVIF